MIQVPINSPCWSSALIHIVENYTSLLELWQRTGENKKKKQEEVKAKIAGKIEDEVIELNG